MKNVAVKCRVERQTLVSRPDCLRLPDWRLPVYPRSAGVTIFGPGGMEIGAGGRSPFVQLNWCVRGNGRMIAGGGQVDVSEGDVVIQMPRERRGNTAVSDDWRVRWLVFDGPNARSFIESYGYPAHLPKAGPCPENLFRDFEGGLRENTLPATRKNIAVLCDIIARAGDILEKPGEGGLTHRFISLAQAGFSDPEVNLNILCDRLGTHRATLSRLFVRQMHVSPGKYVLQLRIQHALHLLKGTGLAVADVARDCGFSDPAHFSRVVRQATGLSPSAFRKSL